MKIYLRLLLSGIISELEWNAFWDCDSLTNIAFPEGLISIGSDALGRPGNPSDVISISLPSTVTSIALTAFGHEFGCYNVTFPNGMSDELKADFENHKTDLWGADTITIIENGVSTTYTAS